MAECKYYVDEICVNADCPMCADYCPVPDISSVCKYEDRDGKQHKDATMISVRERLINLMSSAGWNLFTDDQSKEQLADFLIANGVMVKMDCKRQIKWCDNQPISDVGEDSLCIIIKLKGTEYVSAGWKSKIKGQYYGDYMMLNPDCENPDENLKKTVCALIDMYVSVKDVLEGRNDG